MLGDNPKRPPVKGGGQTLQVQEIFPTVQGEGPFVGYPAVFLRLGGCNLACDFCDTEFESFETQSVDKICNDIQGFRKNYEGCALINLVVVTGGEPFRQPIGSLCERLLEMGCDVQIETNGTLWRDIPQDVSIVCSPKNIGNGYVPVREDLLPRVTAFKFIISASHPLYGDAPDVGQSVYDTPVYVQPMDEYDEAKNKANRKRVVELSAKHGYRIGVQMHKVLGVE